MGRFSTWVSESLDVITLVHGFGMVVPWNMLINANRYFVKFKLDAGPDSSEALINYNRYFISYVGIVSRVANIFFQLVNMLFYNSQYGSLWLRTTLTLTIELIVFTIFIILAFIDTNHVMFFWLTIGLTFILNVANGFYTSSVFAAVVNLPPQYFRALTFGKDICGIVVSLVNIFSIAISPSAHVEGLVYFSFAVLILGICLLTQIYLNSSEFKRYLAHLKESHIKEQSLKGIKYSESITIDTEEQETQYLIVFKKIILQLLDLFLIHFVTFSIFPAIEANIKTSDNLIPKKYFEAVFCFLVFNVFTFVGNMSAQLIPFPITQLMISFGSVRLLLIPLYLMFNYKPMNMTRDLPVLVTNDWVYLILNIFTAYTSSHLAVLCLRYTHVNVSPKYKSSAGMLASITIMTGMASGLTFSLLFPEIV